MTLVVYVPPFKNRWYTVGVTHAFTQNSGPIMLHHRCLGKLLV